MNNQTNLRFIEYTLVEIKENLNPISNFWEFRKDILLQAQGSSFIIKENEDIHKLMFALEILHPVCPEAVLLTKENYKILIYEHQFEDVLRDSDIITDFLKPDYKLSEPDYFENEFTLDLEKIWLEILNTNKNYIDSLKQALYKIKEHFKYAEITTLYGKAPAFLFLYLQHELINKVGELWYQEDETSKAIKIRPLLI